MRLAARTARIGAAEAVDRSAWYSQRWRAAAEHRGWKVGWRSHGFMSIERDGRRTIVREADTGLDFHSSFRVAGNKALTSLLFDRAEIPHPTSSTYRWTDMAALIGHVRRLGSDAVVKPTAGTGGGRGVTVGPVGRALTGQAVAEAFSHGRSLSVEERVEGAVVRALVIGGEVCDVVSRRPAHVVGDGRATIDELVRRENERRRALGPLSTGFVPTGADYRSALARQELNRSSVIDDGREVAVAGRSNSGSEKESCRTVLSSAGRALAIRVASTVGLAVAGVDLVVAPDGSPSGVIEVNTAPGLHWHVLVSGEAYDPFNAVLLAIEEARVPSRPA